MKRVISIFFIFLCIAAEVSEGNTFLVEEESSRIEERAGKVELEETFTPFFKERNLIRREPASRRLIAKDHSSVKRISEVESNAVKIQYQLHTYRQQYIPVYLVKKVFLI